MKQKSGLLVLLILSALAVNPGAAHPQTEKEGDRTRSAHRVSSRPDALSNDR